MMTEKQFATLMAEFRALRREVKRRLGPVDARDFEDLVAAIAKYFGQAGFTAAGIVDAANSDGDLFDAVHELVDLEGACPAIELGRILSKLPQLERVGDLRGAGLFRLRQ